MNCFEPIGILSISKQFMNPQQQNQNSEEENWFLLGSSVERAISAPPIMDSLEARLSSNSIFAFQSKYSHLFGDIRFEEEYETFYNNHSDQSKLPAPISFEIFDLAKKKVMTFS